MALLHWRKFVFFDEEIIDTELNQIVSSKEHIDSLKKFAVGRNDAIYFYQADERGSCLSFEGEKLALNPFKNYLAIVSKDLQVKNEASMVKNTEQQENGYQTQTSESVNLNIYDIRHKYVAYSSIIPEIQEMFSEWNHLFVICKNGKIKIFREKDVQNKLVTLFRENQSSSLEQLVEDSTEFATKAVYNLLLELYLSAWRKEKDDLMRNWHADRIKRLISRFGDKFDLDYAMILCKNTRFDEGLLELYAKAKLYHLILQYHIDQDDSLEIIKTCERYGEENPEIYMPALIHYSKTGDERLCQLIRVIELHKIILPMVVIKILLTSNRTKLGAVKEYLVRFLGRLHDRQLDNENAIDQYKDETEVVHQKIEEFQNHQTVFKSTTCSACNGALDLPSVHFLCAHSYHQNCFLNLAESEECPNCVTTNRNLLDEIESSMVSKTTLNELEKQFSIPSEDMFFNVTELFGYGLLN